MGSFLPSILLSSDLNGDEFNGGTGVVTEEGMERDRGGELGRTPGSVKGREANSDRRPGFDVCNGATFGKGRRGGCVIMKKDEGKSNDEKDVGTRKG
ncbi:hypothetical protein PRIPAC_72009 [Pristionchus pacificus]|uniref:Uncharacterized protein n=1 Tax=Pristionchus pacificus TaxID=54126 RepID=A0A2A6D0F0_PRIPA|nr:hypothetical protein PRIPAC_72009 [Pristionchus pacificus]|eukprot:PDM83753.1 hypothetical protein PRIPAC_30240 [Pristionchus pacificus]